MHDVEYCMITSPIQHIHHAPTKVTWRSYDRWKKCETNNEICWQSFVEAAGSYKCSRKATAPCVRNITRPLFPSSEQATRMKQNWIDILYDQSDDWNRLKIFQWRRMDRCDRWLQSYFSLLFFCLEQSFAISQMPIKRQNFFEPPPHAQKKSKRKENEEK